MNFKEHFSEVTQDLDGLDRDREEVLRKQRQIIRDCSLAIKSIHREEFDVFEEKTEKVASDLEELREIIGKNEGYFYKYLRTPEQEYVEAMCFYALVNKDNPPKPSDLKVDALNYSLGLADVVGELRRYALDNIRNSEIEDLNAILEAMDEIYSNLFSLDYPSGLTKDLRHKTDIARNIMEKTRGDISLTLKMDSLRKCIEDKMEK